MPVGEHVVVSGRMEWFNGRPTMVHPDHIALASEAEALPLVEPVYPLTAGLSGKVLRRAIGQALGRLPELPEWQDAAFMRRQTFPAFGDALARIHNPADPIDVAIEGAAWRRLAYDELLAGQVSLALVRAKVRRLSGRPLIGDGRIVEKLRAALPYSLTASQEFALAEINADLADPERMLRLLQGDVGSGKTVVALLAMARAVEAGGQAALMAPTEILARQHLATIAPLAEQAGLRVAILTGREKGRERTDTLAGLASGDDRHRRRHPCAVPGNGDVPRPRLRRRRRAAPLRRPPAACHHRQGRCARHAGDDGDADPAHAGADRLRRHGRVEADGKAGRPPADPHRHPAARAAGRTGRPHARRRRRRPENLLDLPAGRGIRRDQADVGRGPLCLAEAAVRRPDRPRAWPHEGRRKGRGDARLQGRARRASWSPPRSSRSASTCRTRRSWSSSMPSASALRNCTSCAAASGAATSRHPACCSTRIRSARRQNAGCR